MMMMINNAVVWMVSVRLPIYKFSSPFSKLFGAVPSTPFIIGNQCHLHVL